jgi:hypothetical protein
MRPSVGLISASQVNLYTSNIGKGGKGLISENNAASIIEKSHCLGNFKPLQKACNVMSWAITKRTNQQQSGAISAPY